MRTRQGSDTEVRKLDKVVRLPWGSFALTAINDIQKNISTQPLLFKTLPLKDFIVLNST